jgi:hypothetical protein
MKYQGSRTHSVVGAYAHLFMRSRIIQSIRQNSLCCILNYENKDDDEDETVNKHIALFTRCQSDSSLSNEHF